jgi:RHS repeat-associated protein
MSSGTSTGTGISGRIGKRTSPFTPGASAAREVIGGTNTANSFSGGIDEVFQRTDSAGARSFLTDALGSTLALTDSSGTVQTSYSFEPFGNTTQSGSSTTNSFAYTGRELDAGNLYFYRARYYNPQLQRFISEDQIGFDGGVNFYAYAQDDPVNLVDPLGLDSTNQQIQSQLIQGLQNLFPGSRYDPQTNALVIPQDTQTVQQTLQAQGYQQPGQWWNPFLYWDPIFHSGGDEYRTGIQTISFHFRKEYPPCPIGALNPASCALIRPQMVGRKTVLDQFHIDSSNPAVDPVDHIIHDFLKIPRF